jgi:O-antigen/teichoic acid export membrane protein
MSLSTTLLRKGSASRDHGRRALLTMTDQALSSLSNFAVGLIIARSAGPRALGVFSLAYAVWLLVAGFHRALITDPLMIEGRAKDLTVSDALRAECLFGAVAAVAVLAIGVALGLVGAGAFGTGLCVLALSLPTLLIQDFWRWIAFMRRQPGKAIVNDAAFMVVQFLGLFIVLGSREASVIVVISTWGAGSLVGAALGLVQFRREGSTRGAIGYIRQTWPSSRWLSAEFATQYAATNAYLFIVVGMLGPVGVGALRAAQNLLGPTNLVLQLGGSVGLPETVEAFNRDGWNGLMRRTRLIGRWIVTAVALYAGLVAIFPRTIIRFAYGSTFADFAPIATLVALQYIISSFAWGSNIGLKASRNTRALFLSRLFIVFVSLIATLVLTPAFGLTGAAVAGVISASASAAIAWVTLRRVRPSSWAGASGRHREIDRRVETHVELTAPQAIQG